MKPEQRIVIVFIGAFLSGVLIVTLLRAVIFMGEVSTWLEHHP